MKTRKQPKVRVKHDIIRDHKIVGFIQMVSYMAGESTWHIEFALDEAYRGKGIMNEELPKYIKVRKKYEWNQMIAIVKKDNMPSIKLLERNGFIKVTEIGDKLSYIIDLRLTPEIITKIVNKIDMEFNVPINYNELSQ